MFQNEFNTLVFFTLNAHCVGRLQDSSEGQCAKHLKGDNVAMNDSQVPQQDAPGPGVLLGPPEATTEENPATISGGEGPDPPHIARH